MNTVDALKNLYKTMSGKDWPYDPNPTDAEVIDKIAADGSAGGTSGPTILIRQPGLTADPIAPGLSLTEFAMSTVLMVAVKNDTSIITNVIPFIGARLGAVGSDGKPSYKTEITVPSPLGKADAYGVVYNPNTGELYIERSTDGGNS